MIHTKQRKLQEAIREVRTAYHDAIASSIQKTAKSYAEIGLSLGCSEQLVYTVARERGLRRTCQQPTNANADADVADEGKEEGSHE